MLRHVSKIETKPVTGQKYFNIKWDGQIIFLVFMRFTLKKPMLIEKKPKYIKSMIFSI